MSIPILMGVVNVTPDSFSDGGQFLKPEDAVAHGRRLIEEGAHILDIGGESTRPGAEPVSADEEIARVVPVIEGLKGCKAVLSVDARRTEVMRAALQAGATMINDVQALQADGALELVADSKASVCLMHMKGEPGTMQDNPQYEDVVAEVYEFLQERMAACEAAGIPKDRIIVDPGVGFGKTLDHNLDLLHNIQKFHTLGVPVLVGASRKRFIEAIDSGAESGQRLPGSLAAALWGMLNGVQIFRVHDVAETRQAFQVFQAIAA